MSKIKMPLLDYIKAFETSAACRLARCRPISILMGLTKELTKKKLCLISTWFLVLFIVLCLISRSTKSALAKSALNHKCIIQFSERHLLFTIRLVL